MLLLFLIAFASLNPRSYHPTAMSWVNSQQLHEEKGAETDVEMEAGRMFECFSEKQHMNLQLRGDENLH